MNNKCKIILTIILVLAILSAGYLFYIKYQESKQGPVSYESFKKIEENGKVFLENKEVGLRFRVPDGWNDKYDGTASISLASQNFKSFNNTSSSASIPQSGCWIGSTVIITDKNDSEYVNLLEMVEKENLQFLDTNNHKYEIVNIGGRKAVKEVFNIDSGDNLGKYIYIKIPLNYTLYNFEADLFGQDREKCQEDFEDFLQNVSI